MKPETDSNVMSRCQCGCPEVSLAWADCLSLIVCDVVFCVYVCVCTCVGASALSLSQLFVYTAGLQRVEGFAGSCYCICAPPKTWTLHFLLCSLNWPQCIRLQASFIYLFILIPDLNPTLAFLYCWQGFSADAGVLWSVGAPLTLLLGSISAPGRPLSCLRSLVRNWEWGRDWSRSRGSSDNAYVNQISQEWISCV